MTDIKIDEFLKTFREEDDFLSNINSNNLNSEDHIKFHAMIKLLIHENKVIQNFNKGYRLTDKGIDIYKKGGWIKYNQLIDEIERIAFAKSKADLLLVEKTLEEFPKTKFFARTAFIIAIILMLKELYTLIYK
ncbi:hypothetical protein [Flavobacterium algicola]|uniref:hypothetical protein n=1 Tax=Flavobacterium algicola TaxID=556529 RepID=UPI001EFDD1CE|nr:hypothetical protein [Flavobacterium algicola]MCG9791546.1 hypothetical protein [Flavobacterium algicola]